MLITRSEMNLFACSIVLFSFAACYGQMPNIYPQEKIEECKKAEGASDFDELDVYSLKPPKTPKGSCLQACLLEDAELLLPDKTISKANLLESMEVLFSNEEKYADIKSGVEECLKNLKPTGDRCAVAKDFLSCTYKVLEKVGYLTKIKVNVIDFCLLDTGASVPEMLNFFKENGTSNSSGCIYACMMKNLTLMDSNNKIQKDKIKEEYKDMMSTSPEIAAKFNTILDSCINNQAQPKDACAVAKTFMTCISDKAMEIASANSTAAK